MPRPTIPGSFSTNTSFEHVKEPQAGGSKPAGLQLSGRVPMIRGATPYVAPLFISCPTRAPSPRGRSGNGLSRRGGILRADVPSPTHRTFRRVPFSLCIARRPDLGWAVGAGETRTGSTSRLLRKTLRRAASQARPIGKYLGRRSLTDRLRCLSQLALRILGGAVIGKTFLSPDAAVRRGGHKRGQTFCVRRSSVELLRPGSPNYLRRRRLVSVLRLSSAQLLGTAVCRLRAAVNGPGAVVHGRSANDLLPGWACFCYGGNNHHGDDRGAAVQ